MEREQVQKRRNGETVLDIVHENDRLRQRISELEAENEQKKPERQYGEVKSGLYFRQYVGEGTLDNGETFELDVMNNFSPSVYYKGKTFMLPWKDIVELANQAGLFDEVTE